MRAALPWSVLVLLCTAAAARADDPPKTQWLPGMPVQAAPAPTAGAAQRVTSPEGNFAVLAPPGWTAASTAPDLKEIVDRVRLQGGSGKGEFLVEVRPWRLDTQGDALQRFAEREIAGYQTDFVLQDVSPAQAITVAGRPAWQARGTASGKGGAATLWVAIASDGTRRIDAIYRAPQGHGGEATWTEILGSVELLSAAYSAQPVRDDLGQFSVTPPAGWLRFRAEGEPPATADFRTLAFPSRDGSGAQFTVEVVKLTGPAATQKIPSDRLLQSYKANVIDKNGGKDAQEVARGQAKSVRGEAVTDYAIWTFTNSKGEAQFLMAGGVARGGAIYSMLGSGPKDQLTLQRSLLEAAFGSLVFAAP